MKRLSLLVAVAFMALACLAPAPASACDYGCSATLVAPVMQYQQYQAVQQVQAVVAQPVYVQQVQQVVAQPVVSYSYAQPVIQQVRVQQAYAQAVVQQVRQKVVQQAVVQKQKVVSRPARGGVGRALFGP